MVDEHLQGLGHHVLDDGGRRGGGIGRDRLASGCPHSHRGRRHIIRTTTNRCLCGGIWRVAAAARRPHVPTWSGDPILHEYGARTTRIQKIDAEDYSHIYAKFRIIMVINDILLRIYFLQLFCRRFRTQYQECLNMKRPNKWIIEGCRHGRSI